MSEISREDRKFLVDYYRKNGHIHAFENVDLSETFADCIVERVAQENKGKSFGKIMEDQTHIYLTKKSKDLGIWWNQDKDWFEYNDGTPISDEFYQKVRGYVLSGLGLRALKYFQTVDEEKIGTFEIPEGQALTESPLERCADLLDEGGNEASYSIR